MGYYENDSLIKLTVLRKKKDHENCLENDIAFLEKRLDEGNLMETEKNQILDELAPRKLQTLAKWIPRVLGIPRNSNLFQDMQMSKDKKPWNIWEYLGMG